MVSSVIFYLYLLCSHCNILVQEPICSYIFLWYLPPVYLSRLICLQSHPQSLCFKHVRFLFSYIGKAVLECSAGSLILEMSAISLKVILFSLTTVCSTPCGTLKYVIYWFYIISSMRARALFPYFYTQKLEQYPACSKHSINNLNVSCHRSSLYAVVLLNLLFAVFALLCSHLLFPYELLILQNSSHPKTLPQNFQVTANLI